MIMKKNEWDTKKSFELEEYSRSVRGYFSKMKKIRNDLRLDRANYGLNQDHKQKILVKLDKLIVCKEQSRESIEEHFNSEINLAYNLIHKHQVFYKYNELLKDCYGKSIYEFLNDVDITSKLNYLKSNSTNNTDFKEDIYHKSITPLKIFDFSNKEHQAIVFSNKFSALIFTPSIQTLKSKQKLVSEEVDEIFEDFLIDVLHEQTGYKYVDEDIAIVITPQKDLKDMFSNNYNKNYAYFVSIIDEFLFIFDE